MYFPQVDLGDSRVADDLSDRAAREDLAVVQHRDLLGDLADERHVVLDDDDRHALRIEALDQFTRAEGLVGRHASGRLVHQHQRRLQCQGHANLEPLLLAVRELAGRLGLIGSEFEQLEQAVFLLAEVGARHVVLQRDVHVLAHRQFAEHARRLHFDAHPALDALVRALLGDVVVRERYVSGAGHVGADDQLEKCALAGPVRPDQAMDLTALDNQVDIGDSGEAAKAFGQRNGAQQLAHRCSPSSARRPAEQESACGFMLRPHSFW